MANKYIEKFRRTIKDAKTDEEVDATLNRIYSDGFEDGCDMGE